MSPKTITSHTYQWHGRHDAEDGQAARRVHHIARPIQVDELANHPQGIALIGFECDAGVERNQGRIGAKHAPNLIKQALANLAWHHPTPLYDLGNIRCEGDELEQAQQNCALVIQQALPHAPTIVLGGGHEIAWANFQGFAQHLIATNVAQPRIGIINFDAHFDLRTFESDLAPARPSSGTAFHQIHHFCQQQGWDFHYACLGVSRASNTPALFARAEQFGVWYVEDNAFSPWSLNEHLTRFNQFIDHCDYLYLTIDLDVFPAATAPGVSAPAARGVSIEALAPYLEQILVSNHKLMIADIAEYNPNFDIDQHTARLAARLCWEIANAMALRVQAIHHP